jgi:transglutaminase-like putative cysteine protease
MSELFYKKLLQTYNVRLLSDNFIFSTIRWLINSRYRTTIELNRFLSQQLIRPSKKIKDLAKSLKGKDDDTTVINILRWVNKHIKYRHDVGEEWITAEETLERGADDCDGQNGLVYVLCRLAGVHQYKLFCGIGDMTDGGHFWTMYYSTKYMKLVSIDATYYTKLISIANREEFNDLSYHKNIWYLFNEEIVVRPI